MQGVDLADGEQWAPRELGPLAAWHAAGAELEHRAQPGTKLTALNREQPRAKALAELSVEVFGARPGAPFRKQGGQAVFPIRPAKADEDRWGAAPASKVRFWAAKKAPAWPELRSSD
jgi:hypothetical protein